MCEQHLAVALKEDVMRWRWGMSSILNGPALIALCHRHSKIHNHPRVGGE